ncbi:MAG: biliverdin-producing heme oxygenase [Chlamydiota bacterium]
MAIAIIKQNYSLSNSESIETEKYQRKMRVFFAPPRPLLVDTIFNQATKHLYTPAYIALNNLSDKKKYLQYLCNLSHDLALLEYMLLTTNPSIPVLPALYRTEAIALDIGSLGGTQCTISKCMRSFKRSSYLMGLSQAPHRLLAHLSVHYWGFLSGGSDITSKISKTWGKHSVALYRFKSSRAALHHEFQEQMHKHFKSLSNKEFQEFQSEVPKAWKFLLHQISGRFDRAFQTGSK